jgi:hypothetical protein
MYFLWLLADFLPWSLLLFAAPLATWRRWKLQPPVVTVILAVAAPLLVYSCFGNKNAKYMLPAYPLVAILLGKRLGDLLDTAGPAMRRSLLAAALLFPAGYAAFYAVAESRVFAYRYSAFPDFTSWLAEVGSTPLYGYIDLDERLIYYAKRDIPILNSASLQEKCSANSPLLLLAEGTKASGIETMAGCVVKQFKPYLKKDKSLTVYGFGSACATNNQ